VSLQNDRDEYEFFLAKMVSDLEDERADYRDQRTKRINKAEETKKNPPPEYDIGPTKKRRKRNVPKS